MTEDRILAVDIANLLNAAVKESLGSENPVTFGEILFALRVCAAVIISDIPKDRREGYIQMHMIHSAEMLGIPTIPMEVDMPDREKMN